jgi:hypothetical protein
MRNKPKFDRDDVILGVVIIVLTFLVLVAILSAAVADAVRNMRVTSPAADEPSDGGVQRVTAAVRYMAPAEEDAEFFTLEEYREGDGPAPEWYRPDEPMAAEWRESYRKVASKLDDAEPHPPVGIDAGGIDWNLCTDLEGWDGHRMEVWEMDLFSRIVFLEFGTSSPECREAGIDAILRLWESGYYSDTMFGTLSAVAENGKPAFSTYPGVWEEEYDYEKLALFREECEERFMNGPVWIAPFFRLDHYHDWAVPCYEIDGVFFSTGKGW